MAPALGITIACILGLSAYFTFQIGRLFSFAYFILAVYYAIRLMPFGKQMIATIALIPQNLHIMASYSYDVFTTYLIMTISYCLYRIKNMI